MFEYIFGHKWLNQRTSDVTKTLYDLIDMGYVETVIRNNKTYYRLTCLGREASTGRLVTGFNKR